MAVAQAVRGKMSALRGNETRAYLLRAVVLAPESEPSGPHSTSGGGWPYGRWQSERGMW